MLNKQICSKLGHRWKEEDLKKITARKKSGNIFLRAQYEGCEEANVYKYFELKVDSAG